MLQQLVRTERHQKQETSNRNQQNNPNNCENNNKPKLDFAFVFEIKKNQEEDNRLQDDAEHLKFLEFKGF
jgi:hypothetical protein